MPTRQAGSTAGPNTERDGAGLLAIALFSVGLSVGSIHAGLAKGLSAELPVLMIVWGRYLSFFIVSAGISIAITGKALLRPQLFTLQVVRGLAFLTSATCTIAALRGLPLADTIAILFIYPFVATALSAPVLRERLRVAHWLSILGGFIGVLVVMRPEFDGVSIYAVLALMSGVAFGIQLVITRRLSGTATATSTATYTALVGAIVMSTALPWIWVDLTAHQVMILALIGLIAAGGQFMVVTACNRAPASALAPFGYLEIIGAAIVGYLMFGDVPDAITLSGIAIIVLSGVYIATATRR